MLQRTISYAAILRVLGACFLVYGLSVIMLALTAQIEMGGSVQYSGAMLFQDPMDVENFIFYGGLFPGNPLMPTPYRSLEMFGVRTPGPLLWVGLGILCVSLTMRRAQIAYAGLQATLWMVSVSVWSPVLWSLGSTQYGLGAVGPLFLVTLALSLILLAFYKPVTHSLTRLVSAPL